MVVLFRGPSVDKSLGGERPVTLLRSFQSLQHFRGPDVLLQPKEHTGIIFRIEQVIALVLRIAHAKPILDVLGQGMNLERQVPAIHRIQEVKTDREFRAESGMDSFAQQFSRM